jgi:hypothetical protein
LRAINIPMAEVWSVRYDRLRLSPTNECSFSRSGHNSAQRKPNQLHDRSKKLASLEVARNCGIGQQAGRAGSKAFESPDAIESSPLILQLSQPSRH